MVWAHEGEYPECFTGIILNEPQQGGDSSTLWLIEHIDRVEEPTPEEAEFA